MTRWIRLGLSLLAAGGAIRGGEQVETILVGTDKGVVRIAATEGSRATDARGLPEQSIRALARDPFDLAIWAGSGMRGTGLFVSRDGGQSFASARDWPATREAWSVAFAGEGRVLVGSQPADLWERDAKGAWRKNSSIAAIPDRKGWTFVVEPHEAHLLCLAVDPRSPRRWLAAVEQGGVLVSEDGAVTWRQDSPLWDTHVVLPLGGADLAATNEGIYRRDSGEGWTRADGPLAYATGLCRDAKGMLFAAFRGSGETAIWKSEDSGRSWRAHRTTPRVPEPGHGVHALVAHPSQAGVLYHGAEGEVWRIDGATAKRIASDLPAVRRLLIVP